MFKIFLWFFSKKYSREFTRIHAPNDLSILLHLKFLPIFSAFFTTFFDRCWTPEWTTKRPQNKHKSEPKYIQSVSGCYVDFACIFGSMFQPSWYNIEHRRTHNIIARAEGFGNFSLAFIAIRERQQFIRLDLLGWLAWLSYLGWVGWAAWASWVSWPGCAACAGCVCWVCWLGWLGWLGWLNWLGWPGWPS